MKSWKYILLILNVVFMSGLQAEVLKIVGGREASPESYPWVVALVRANSANASRGQLCGGTLIKPNWVLTAAHCVVNLQPRSLDVVLGRHDLAQDSVGERIHAKKFIINSAYRRADFNNDIALIELETPSNQPVLKYLTPDLEDLSGPGTTTTVVGYGALNEYAFRNAGKAFEVDVPIVSNQECKTSYGEEAIADSMICAGYSEGGKDSCQGDSGGPLIIENKFLVGIVSWGEGCARPRHYGVYTRVSKFSDWIGQNVIEEDLVE